MPPDLLSAQDILNKVYDHATRRLRMTTQFTVLTDVPSDYTGEAGKALLVTATEDGLEAASDVTLSIDNIRLWDMT